MDFTSPDFQRFLASLGNILLWSVVSIVITVLLFEILEKKYRLLQEIFSENSTAAAILAASFVLGIFYTVAQIVIH
ncbi:MAG: hypothetical protein HY675_28840 [Chloroflexi bacterium]|nr:hypothetical protein [Chloroflexota bacterium]